MNIRTLLAGLCAFVVACSAEAQQSATVAKKIGVLTISVGPTSSHREAFRQGLRDHGYIEGKNIVLEYRHAQGQSDRLPGMAAELIRLNVDVIVTESTPAAVAAKQATKTIPIVMAVVTDPVKLGLVVSLAHPGGNVTGLTLAGADRTAKQLEMLKEAVPKATIVAVIHNGSRPDSERNLREARETARTLGLALKDFDVRNPGELDTALAAVARARPSGLITVGDGMLLSIRKRILDFAAKSRLPSVFPEREWVADGGLMAYGPSLEANFRRAATFVDKILKGAKPADLPVEQPTKFDLVVNLKTAQTLGVKIPQSVLVRADEVIQ